MESYEVLLDKAYEKVRIVSASSERFDVPRAEGMVSGRNTVITNISAIASYIRRPVEHLVKFLLKELASNGKLENDRLVLNTRINSEKFNEKVLLYAKEFVICPECKKPDTEIISDKGVRYKHCLACGAKSPVK